MRTRNPFARSLFLLFLLACLLTGLAGTVRVPVSAAPMMQTGTNIVISQVYGGGGMQEHLTSMIMSNCSIPVTHQFQ